MRTEIETSSLAERLDRMELVGFRPAGDLDLRSRVGTAAAGKRQPGPSLALRQDTAKCGKRLGRGLA